MAKKNNNMEEPLAKQLWRAAGKLRKNIHNTDIIFYFSPEGHIRVEVVYEEETFWLSQKRMAELFGMGVPAISKHLKNIFESGELQED